MMRIAGVLLLAVLAGCAASDRAPDRRPNVLLIVSDDQGFAEMSCQGGEIPTPNLDRLAAAGIRFTAGTVTSPFCSPSRAGLLTGRYQQRFGHEMNPVEKMNDRPEVGLPTTEKTIADHLKAAGYATGMVGKWHLGAHPPYHPLRRGFDEFYGFLREGHFYGPADKVVSHLRPREPEYDRLNPILRGEREEATSEYLTTAFGREAGAFIDRHAAAPFFLYLPFNAPHSPMQATLRDHDRFKHIQDPHRRMWAAMLTSMDDAIGVVLDALRRNGLERDTLIFFISDNGGPTKELTSRNDPFSGGKGSVQEGGIRVPFIVSWPGRFATGKVERRPVSALDVLPTVLAAAGVPAPPGLDGIDLQTERPDRTLFWRMGAQQAIRRGDWKLVRLRAGDPYRLYHLGNDPAESRDLAATEVDRARDLAEMLKDWDRTLARPLW
jgi:arylsulfatase A-like enzyme